MFSWFNKVSVQTFQPRIVVYRRGNLVLYHWECTSIYRLLSYPFGPLDPQVLSAKSARLAPITHPPPLIFEKKGNRFFLLSLVLTLTVHGLTVYGPRHCPYSNYLCRPLDISAVGTILIISWTLLFCSTKSRLDNKPPKFLRKRMGL